MPAARPTLGGRDPKTERLVERVRALTTPQAVATLDAIRRYWATEH